MVKRRKRKARINNITDQGVFISTQQEIKDSAVRYFSAILAEHSQVTEEPVLSGIPELVSPVLNQKLCQGPDMEEIRKVVFDLNKDASAGPDGYTARLFQECWDIIKFDIQEAIIDIFRGANLPVGITATTLAMIPKKENTEVLSNYRPFSLCNNTHKILTKLINGRLVEHLPILISENQSGFVKGRLINDNILLGQELAQSLNLKTRGGNVIIKMDMMKACDRLHWSFLQKNAESFWILYRMD